MIASLRRRAKAVEWAEAPMLGRRLTVLRKFELRESRDCEMPFTVGWLRPTILLPASAGTWEPERRQAVFLHELAHVKRWDWALQIIGRFSLAVYWWNPLVWIAWREFLKERELAADDVVLSMGARPSEYATHLVAIAGQLPLQRSMEWAAVAMVSESQLERRVAAILAEDRDRRPIRKLMAVGGLLVAFAAAFPLAAVQAGADNARDKDLDQQSAAAFLLDEGKAALAAGRFEQADLVFQKVEIEDARQSAAARMWRAISQEKQNNQTAAAELFKGALAAAPPNSGLAATIMELYATDLRRLNQDDEAQKLAHVANAIWEAQERTPEAAPSHKVYRIGEEGARAPVLVSKVEPQYSDDARLAKYTGSVLLEIEIDENGMVQDPRTLRGLGLGLDEKAIEAVRQWQFKPGMIGGKPVPVAAHVEVTFQLK